MRRLTWVPLTAIAAVVAVFALQPVVSTPAQATPSSSSPAAVKVPVPKATMSSHSAATFTTQAAALPAGLQTAIGRDLKITPAAYLAQSAAAVNAADVIASLRTSGVDVSHAQMQGTTLVVGVKSAADRAAVTAAGATAVPVADVVAPKVDTTRMKTLSGSVQGGLGWAYWIDPAAAGEEGDYVECSIGFNGHNVSTGADQFLTAGHCYDHAFPPDPDNPNAFLIGATAPGTGESQGDDLTPPNPAQFEFGGNSAYDNGLINVPSGLNISDSSVTWSGGSGSPSTSVNVTGESAGVVGAGVCKSGTESGWTCGTILAVDSPSTLKDDEGNQATINSIVTNACAIPGDSGGPLMMGTVALGTLSGGLDCGPGQATAFFPLVSTAGKASSTSGTGVTANWEIGVHVATPVVTSGSTIFSASGATFGGTLASGTTRHSIAVTFDGSGSPVSIPVASNGTWSATLSSLGLGTGAHTYSLYAHMGTWSKSATVAGTFHVYPMPKTSRIAGADRYTGAAAVAAEFGTASTVYIASGANFPDALGAAPAAARINAPLLLVEPDAIPEAVANELTNLHPAKIVVVGGAASVSDGVKAQLASYSSLGASGVSRVSGVDRYETSRLVSSSFPAGTTHTAFIATGSNFPDALSASAAAGKLGAPVILLNGSLSTVDQPTLSLLASLGVQTIDIAGGTGSVSQGIRNQLAVNYTVVPYGGADRYGTSEAINHATFTSANTVYLATGLNYPDALAGAALAGSSLSYVNSDTTLTSSGPSPLFVVPTNCVPGNVLADIGAMGATSVTLFGGTGALTSAVQNLQVCPGT